MEAIKPMFPSWTSSAAGAWSSRDMMAFQFCLRMAGRLGCWCRISTSGRARNGFAASASWRGTNAGSGNHLDITTTAIPGKSRDMTATESSVTHRKLEWQLTEVRDIVVETPRVKSLLLKAARWPGHLPGQHVDIRLTADDGYQAQRSYSIASPPEEELLVLTVERVKDGEVSPYLLDELRVGDRLELRGPIGAYFVWTGAVSGPLCLIAGGSGVTPLMAMLRHRERLLARAPA